MPCSATPPSGSRLAFATRSMLPSTQKTVSASEQSPFGAESHGLGTPCVRFAAKVTLDHATLGTGWLPTFAGQTTNLLGPTKRFQSRYPLHNFPLFQALPGALSAETFSNWGNVLVSMFRHEGVVKTSRVSPRSFFTAIPKLPI